MKEKDYIRIIKFQKGEAEIYADKELFSSFETSALKQLENVSSLPNIELPVKAMPDLHCGYGFPIGCVAAFDLDKEPIISPGGIGYDINCGVRFLKTDLEVKDIKGKEIKILSELFSAVPCGAGKESKLKISFHDLKKILETGVDWVFEKQLGDFKNKDFLEVFEGQYQNVSKKALERGLRQLGTLGGGNHFLEIQKVEEIFDKDAAQFLGLRKDLISVCIHTGSRGLGHQICCDWLEEMRKESNKYRPPDPQLAYAPLNSGNGNGYFYAMNAAANFAAANREIISHQTAEVFKKIFGTSDGFSLITDISHNMAKIEKIKDKKFLIHRKGAACSYPPGSVSLPQKYQTFGFPVIIPGDMGRYSFLCKSLIGCEKTFYSCAHGAGRAVSRSRALKESEKRDIRKELAENGVFFKAENFDTLAEEMPYAYKDAQKIVSVTENAGLASKIVKLKPLAVIKG